MDLEDVYPKMEKAFQAIGEELSSIQAGRASPSLVERIMVEAYETRMPLVELATIASPEPNQLLITPFDQSVIRNIANALSQTKNLKLSPVIDNQAIRIMISPLTAERREELIKLLKQRLETGRIMIRQIRQEKRVLFKQAFENDEISEDAKFSFEEDLQKITDQFMEKIEEMGKRKETELRTV